MSRWWHPAGSAAGEGWQVRLPPGEHLGHAGLLVRELAAGESVDLAADGIERLLVPLTGGVEVGVAGEAGAFRLRRDGDVHSSAPDVLYVPVDRRVRVQADSGGCRLAVACAPAEELHPVQFRAAGAVQVETRGEPPARRQVRDLGGEHVLQAQRLLVCEVLTPAGGWSSWPPHKHDTLVPDQESVLEEIYYFEVGRDGAAAPHDRPVGYHRTFASDEREIDVCVEVGPGDVALVPYGWHGPCAAPPGYLLYYLNVMAGPGPERTWQVSFHPDYDWTRT